MERSLSENFSLGLAGNFGHNNIDIDGSGSRTKSDDYGINLYGRYTYADWFAGLRLGYAQSQVDNRRDMPLNGLTADADYDIDYWSASLMTGYTFRPGIFDITPVLGFTYMNAQTEAFSESGAGVLNLKYDDNDYDSFEGTLGVDARTTIVADEYLELTPHLNVGVAYEFADRSSKIKTGFAEVPAVPWFEQESSNVSRTSFLVGGGIDARINDGIILGVGYQGRIQDDYQDHSAMLNIAFEF